MSEITIKFRLPDEAEECRIASNAHEYHCALCDISELVRSLDKEWRALDGSWLEEIREILNDVEIGRF